MAWIENLYKDEVRSGFLVTTDRKKIWNVELEILMQFDGICRKHGLRYFADYGTLLGAIRHKGFIPWDDDIDVVMFRPDYEKFKAVAAKEITAPYFFQNIYNCSFASTFSKIMDTRTTAIEFPDMEASAMKQGIFIDVFPLDAVLDGTWKGNRIFQIQKELWCCVINPNEICRGLREHLDLALESNTLEKLIAMPYLERMRELETFCLHHCGDTDCIGFFATVMQYPETRRKKEWYSDIIYMPFETIQIPAPSGYNEILKAEYGNYQEFVMGGSAHENIVFSVDIPYEEYLESVVRA